MPALENTQTTGFDFAQLESTPVVDTTSVENVTPMVDTGLDFANVTTSAPEITTDTTAYNEYQTTQATEIPTTTQDFDISQFTTSTPVSIPEPVTVPEPVSIPETYSVPEPVTRTSNYS